MADLSECLESSFDPVQWINDAINSREDQEEPLERYVAELEMKLQLAAEELETSLTDQSELALRRIPAAIHDINRLQREAESMGGQLHSLHGALPSEQRKASYAVRGLRQVMEVKARMEGACATLQEATELAELLTDIDAVFSRGDVVGMAEMVARMRRSLHLVKEVKELSGSLDRLQILEQRLEASLEPSLSEAMLTRQGEKVRDTWRIFGSIQQQAKAEAIYVAIGISRLQELWNAAATAGSGGGSGGGAMAWMPDLQDRLAREMETDYAFCAAALPEQAPSLTVRVVEGFWQRVHEACGQMLREVVAKGGEDGAARIIGLRDNAVRYCDHLLGVLQGATDAQKQSVASAFQQPFEVVVDAYGELERALLLRLVADVPVQAGGSGGEDELDATVAQLFASQDTTAALVRAAAARCLALTGDTSLPALLQVADEALALFVSRILALIQSLRENTAARLRRRAPAAAPPPMEASGSAADPLHEELGSPAAAAAARAGGGAPAEALEQVEMNALLRLLLFCSRLVAQLSQLEVQCRGRIAALAPVLAKAAAGPADPADLVQLRLAASVPLVKQLAGLEESMKSTRFMALPKALGRASALQGQVTGLVQDTLMAPVQLHLAALRQQAVWEQAESENSFNLPTFSTYPSASITGVGEYLMVLPQQLEYLVPPDTDAMSQDDGGLASEWLDRVTAAAAAEFSQQVLDTPALSAVGAGQLAADAEYLVNVVGALGVAVPPALLTVKEVAGLEPGMFRDHVQAGLQDGALDRKMVLALAAKRDIDISAALASA